MSISRKPSKDSRRSTVSNGSKQPTIKNSKHSSSSSKSSSDTQQGSTHESEGSAHSSIHSADVLPDTCFKSFLEQARTRKKPTLDDFKTASIEKSTLFPQVMTIDSAERLLAEKMDEKRSILVTGFGLRNLKSLQDALDADEQKRLLELYKHQKPIIEEVVIADESTALQHSISTASTSTKDSSTKTAETETELTTARSDISEQKAQLRYLMGLQNQPLEEHYEGFKCVEERPSFIYSKSVSMQEAQRYLRIHRIFDFFQFITAHLLGSQPDNPVEFIIELLNKCLLYRSGLGQPPLLYNEDHILQLFRLMDRMDSGLIEKERYKQGMITLGICEFNKFPQTSPDNMVPKKTFIEEAFRAELILFNDLIREKRSRKTVVQDELQKVSDDVLSKDSAGPYFIPSELFKSLKKERKPASVQMSSSEEG